MIEVFLLVSAVFYLMVTFLVFRDVSSKTLLWPFFLVLEYFYIFGIGIAPIVFIFDTGITYDDQLYKFEEMSPLTPIHALMYSFGACLGYFTFFRQSNFFVKMVFFVKRISSISPVNFFFFLVFLSIFTSLLYISIVGLDLVLISASAIRGGNFDLIEGYTQYRFLNRISLIGIFSVAFLPIFLEKRVYIKTSFFLVIVSSLLIYLISVSRFALLLGVFFPIILYWVYYGKRSLLYNFFLIFSFFMGLVVVLYGKGFVNYLANFFVSDSTVTLGVVELSFKDGFGYFLQHFSHLLLSIDAGVKFFLAEGVVFHKDVLLSPFGILPSGLMSNLGWQSLSYQVLLDSERFACVNTFNVSEKSGCFIPPYFTGASAYTFPIVGGFLFGFIRFHIYRMVFEVISRCKDIEVLVIALFLLLSIDQIFLFIPNTISLIVFIIVLFVVTSFCFSFLKRKRC